MPAAAAAAALMDELVKEFLLRLPPDDPASLVNAALVCKRWGRLIAGPAFRRKFRKIHHAKLLHMARGQVFGGGAAGSDGAARPSDPMGLCDDVLRRGAGRQEP